MLARPCKIGKAKGDCMDRLVLHYQFSIGVGIAISAALVLLALKPRDRGAIRNLLVLLGIFVLVQLIAIALRNSISPTAERLLSGIASFGVGAVIIRLGGNFLFQVILPRLRMLLPRIAEDLFVTALLAAWCIWWLHRAGLDLSSLLATSAVITAVLAFSMQDTLGNILGGVVLQMDDSVRVGDWVTIENVSGQVVDVRWRHTAIETRNRETVIVPNGWLVKNRFTLIGSRSDAKLRWRRWVWFNLDISAAPGSVCQVLEESVRDADSPHIAQDPPPSAVLMEVGNGYGRYALRYWLTEARPDDPTDSLVRMHALAALSRNRMRLAVVQEERIVIKDNEARHEAIRAVEIGKRRKALEQVDLFGTFSTAELDTLAENMTTAPFVRGSKITRQGRIAHWLYLIVSGEAEVWVEDGGVRKFVATLHPGSVFGEMGMMTGEPRRATVMAKTDVECFRLGKAGFESVLRARPDIANEISSVIVARRTQLESALEAAHAGASAVPASEAIGSRIRGFFGLDAA